MAIRSIAQLKAWFKRGKYPTEEQFADWLDSFIHKTEGEVVIGRIEGLMEAIRNKYPQTAGAELEQLHDLLRADFDAHKGLTESWLGDMVDDIDDIETKVDQHQTEIEQLDNGLNNVYSDIARKRSVARRDQRGTRRPWSGLRQPARSCSDVEDISAIERHRRQHYQHMAGDRDLSAGYHGCRESYRIARRA